MNEVLEPLAQIAGIRLMALITPDGVPIIVQEGRSREVVRDGERGSDDLTRDFAATAGLAAGWLGQIGRAIDPLTWNRPRRAVLRGSRGMLILSRDDSAILMVITDKGIGAEELRLPMESVLARMQRHLRGGHRQGLRTSDGRLASEIDPPPALPRGDRPEPPAVPAPGDESEYRFHEVNGDS